MGSLRYSQSTRDLLQYSTFGTVETILPKESDPVSRPKKFETKLAELESIATTMEKGDLSLEDALKQFEKGVKLAKDCQSTLAEAEQRVQVLTEEHGELFLEDWEEEDE